MLAYFWAGQFYKGGKIQAGTQFPPQDGGEVMGHHLLLPRSAVVLQGQDNRVGRHLAHTSQKINTHTPKSLLNSL